MLKHSSKIIPQNMLKFPLMHASENDSAHRKARISTKDMCLAFF